MSAKVLVIIGMTLGTFFGGYLPILIGVDALSLWSILGSLIGGLAGIYVGFKIANW